MIVEISTLFAFQFFLLFCRIGTAAMLIPGIGEAVVPPNIRVAFALAVTLIMMPILQPTLPAPPTAPAALGVMIAAEILVGLFIGGMTRILLSVMHIAGMIIAFQSSLASAIFFDPTQGAQGAAVGAFLNVMALALIFSTDLHHLMLAGIADSYTRFPPTLFPIVGDFSNFASHLVDSCFRTAIMISAPAIVIGLFLNLASGVMARLMPAMQVFFVLVPIQIWVAFAILALSLTTAMLWYLDYFRDQLHSFFVL